VFKKTPKGIIIELILIYRFPYIGDRLISEHPLPSAPVTRAFDILLTVVRAFEWVARLTDGTGFGHLFTYLFSMQGNIPERYEAKETFLTLQETFRNLRKAFLFIGKHSSPPRKAFLTLQGMILFARNDNLTKRNDNLTKRNEKVS